MRMRILPTREPGVSLLRAIRSARAERNTADLAEAGGAAFPAAPPNRDTPFQKLRFTANAHSRGIAG